MSEIVAFHAANEGGVPHTLTHFTPKTVLSLQLPNGLYVVHGRVAVMNRDSDPQNTSGSIKVRSSLVVLDTMTVHLEGHGEMFFRFQCVLKLEEDDTIDLEVATFVGMWQYASLIAHTVDAVIPPI